MAAVAVVLVLDAVVLFLVAKSENVEILTGERNFAMTDAAASAAAIIQVAGVVVPAFGEVVVGVVAVVQKFVVAGGVAE